MENKRRLATLVGCNYANTRNELRGCINDVKAMRDLLVHRLGFDAKDIVILTDEAGAEVLPTGANIRRVLRCMIDQAKSGDILLFHYSGHGTLLPPAKQQHGRPCHRDEAIVPSDFNLITDVDFRELVDRLPDRATFTMISDSCHSGGLIQNEKEQIGPSTSLISCNTHLLHQQPKFIPFSSILRHLSSISGISSPHIADHLSTLFGSDASPKFVPPTTTLHHPYMDHDEADNDGGILLSGCQANETSADVSPDEAEGTEGKAYGAFRNALQMVMRGEEGRRMSYREVVMKARELLREQGFEQQHPCLYCSDENADKMFLMMDEVKEIDAYCLPMQKLGEEMNGCV